MAVDGPTSEQFNGPTSTGGAYAVVFYRDGDGSPCSRTDAETLEVVEMDADDRPIFRTYAETQRLVSLASLEEYLGADLAG